MCGRYAAAKDQDGLALEFEVELVATGEPGRSVLVNPQTPPPGAPDHNVAPGKQMPVVLSRPPREDRDGEPVRQLRLLTWGLVPSWSADARGGARMINARAESLFDKGAFVRAARSRRALVPADGWYEWQASPTALVKGKPRKQPFFIHRTDGASCAFAGIYEFWRDPGVPDSEDPAAWLSTYSIITAAAEPGLDRIHDRQPVVLERADWERWLDPVITEPDAIRDLLVPRAPGRFAAYPVGRAVNASASNGPHLLEPAPPEDLEGVVDPVTGEIIDG